MVSNKYPKPTTTAQRSKASPVELQ